MERRRLSTPNKISTGAAVLLSAVALAACGGKGESHDANSANVDHGSKTIPSCPPLYAVGAPLASAAPAPKTIAHKRRNHAVNAEGVAMVSRTINTASRGLAYYLPRNVVGEALTHFSDHPRLTWQDHRLIGAARHIFHTVPEKIDGGTTKFVLKTDSTGNIESRVDDLSEEFCTKDGHTYLSNQASDAVAGMEGAKIYPHRLHSLNELFGRFVGPDTKVTG